MASPETPHPPRDRSLASPPASPDRRVEVSLSPGPDGRQELVIQDLSWGAGVGWYVQKTLRLDACHVDAVLGAMCCARQELRSGTTCPHRATEPAAAESGRIVRLDELRRDCG